MLKPNKQYRDVPYSKKNAFPVVILFLTLLQITFYFASVSIAKHEKRQKWVTGEWHCAPAQGPKEKTNFAVAWYGANSQRRSQNPK